MGIICGARKVFLELIWSIRIRAEAFDLQQEMPGCASGAFQTRPSGTGKQDLTIYRFF
jgi:hypothetical protein